MRKSKANLRVESRSKHPNAGAFEREKEFESLMKRFKKMCHDVKIAHLIKIHEFYMKPCDKRRQKKHKKYLTMQKAMNPMKFSKDDEPNQQNHGHY